jgi:hypothetical protein
MEDEKKEIIRSVMALMTWSKEKAMTWYRTPNPFFGGVSPERMVQLDRGHKVRKFIEAAERGWE